jgi:hypothetical protein
MGSHRRQVRVCAEGRRALHRRAVRPCAGAPPTGWCRPTPSRRKAAASKGQPAQRMLGLARLFVCLFVFLFVVQPLEVDGLLADTMCILKIAGGARCDVACGLDSRCGAYARKRAPQAHANRLGASARLRLQRSRPHRRFRSAAARFDKGICPCNHACDHATAAQWSLQRRASAASSLASKGYAAFVRRAIARQCCCAGGGVQLCGVLAGILRAAACASRSPASRRALRTAAHWRHSAAAAADSAASERCRCAALRCAVLCCGEVWCCCCASARPRGLRNALRCAAGRTAAPA